MDKLSKRYQNIFSNSELLTSGGSLFQYGLTLPGRKELWGTSIFTPKQGVMGYNPLVFFFYKFF